MKNTVLILMAATLLTGCADTLYSSMDNYMQSKGLPEPAAENFPHCEGYGCPFYKNVMLNDHDWAVITRAFGKPAETAAGERASIARAVQAFERIVGPITGTDVDVRGTFIKQGPGQMDCVDESTNTTIYMTLLKQKGLIRHHDIVQPQVRWPIVSGRGWMHQTAVVVDKETGTAWAIDSWFEDNGFPPYVVRLDIWRDGWHPGEQAQREVVAAP